MQQSTMNKFFQAVPAASAEPVEKKSRVSSPVREQAVEKRHYEVDGQLVLLSKDQSRVIQAVEEGRHVFFTGAGGVGKSLTLKALISSLRSRLGPHQVYVTASTGIAACNIGGTTLHAFAGLGLGTGSLENLVKKVRTRPDSLKRWRTVQVLVVDEISMIDPQFFETLDMVARRVRPGMLHHAFGGIQLVLAGDFLQLPYVRRSEDQDRDTMPFLFETKTWSLLFPGHRVGSVQGVPYDKSRQAVDQIRTVKVAPEKQGVMIHLTRVFRQNDCDFVECLHAVRRGDPSHHHLDLLKSRLGVRLDCSDGIKPTKLYPHRADVERENLIELHQIRDGQPPQVYAARDKGDPKFVETLEKHCQAPTELTLKVHAQVVLLRNLDFSRGLVNGSRGVVEDFVESVAAIGVTKGAAKSAVSVVAPVVRFTNGEVETIHEAVWSIEMGGEEVASRTQIPLALCWASSIHKAMGMTLDRVEVRLAKVFEEGQAYTALSRVRSLDGLSLLDFDERRIMANPRVVDFYNRLD